MVKTVNIAKSSSSPVQRVPHPHFQAVWGWVSEPQGCSLLCFGDSPVPHER